MPVLIAICVHAGTFDQSKTVFLSKMDRSVNVSLGKTTLRCAFAAASSLLKYDSDRVDLKLNSFWCIEENVRVFRAAVEAVYALHSGHLKLAKCSMVVDVLPINVFIRQLDAWQSPAWVRPTRSLAGFYRKWILTIARPPQSNDASACHVSAQSTDARLSYCDFTDFPPEGA